MRWGSVGAKLAELGRAVPFLGPQSVPKCFPRPETHFGGLLSPRSPRTFHPLALGGFLGSGNTVKVSKTGPGAALGLQEEVSPGSAVHFLGTIDFHVSHMPVGHLLVLPQAAAHRAGHFEVRWGSVGAKLAEIGRAVPFWGPKVSQSASHVLKRISEVYSAPEALGPSILWLWGGFWGRETP